MQSCPMKKGRMEKMQRNVKTEKGRVLYFSDLHKILFIGVTNTVLIDLIGTIFK